MRSSWLRLLRGRGGNIDIGPDQRDRPQRKAANQCDPACDRHGLRVRMAAGFGNVTRQPAGDAEHRDHAGDQDDEHDPGEDVESGHGITPTIHSSISSQITERYRSGSKYSEAGLAPVIPASVMKKSLTCCSHFATVPST